jgi:hypothetical protein
LKEEEKSFKVLNTSSKFKTIWEKLDTYETTNEGKIKLPLIFDNKINPLIFDTMKDYLEWKTNKISELKEKMLNKLTPMEKYITQNKGTERPYTGDYWDNYKVGLYACKVCTQRIFR